MSGGVELDLGCAESDADEFSSSTKSKHSRHVSIEEDQVFEENGDDDDDIAIIEPQDSHTLDDHSEPQISIENDYSNTIETVFVDNTKDSSNYNDSNEEPIDNEIQMELSSGIIKQENDFNDNDQRKTTNVPTLMITVKNERAQPGNVQTIPTNDTTETATLRHIFSDATYFLLKSVNEENITLAKAKGVWSTQSVNEQKLNRAFRDHRNVILIFSVAESKAFQGFARMSCEARRDSQPVDWVLPPGLRHRAFSGVIHIDWITRKSLQFNKTLHLFNSWNENKPVKIGRDGQEIEPRCAEALCRLFPSDPTINIMSIATKAKNNKKRNSSRSQSHSPLSINISSSLPSESSLIIKRQISKDDNRRSSSNNKHRPTSSDFSSRHPTNRHHHRSPSNHDRHRHQQSRSRERNSNDLQRKRRRRSDSSHSDHGGKNNSNRKHVHRNNGDQSSYNNNNTNKTMAKIISSGTYEEYMSHLLATHAQYAGYGTAIFPPGGYPMGYDPSSFYSMGYDHRGMPISMHGGGYDVPMDMYLPQPPTSTSSRSRNPTDYEQEINAFLRHTTTSNSYQPNDNSSKSHRNHRHYRDDNVYHHQSSSSSRHRSKSREHRH